jgi:2-octaprenyl-6-methoxyphenol hydroxylase
VHVSQRGAYGTTLLTAQESGLPALGYVARYDNLQQALAAALRERQVTNKSPIWEPARIIQLDPQPDRVVVTCQDAKCQSTEIESRLVVIADGGGVSDLLSDATTVSVDYQQSAVLATVHTDRLRAGLAFERFTADGPIALLPFETGLALVWTTSPEHAQSLQQMPAQAFLFELQRHFGNRVGRFKQVGSRVAMPLLRRSTRLDAPRLVLIGNAAQTLHPVAGQGFNLGLRDAWELAQLLTRNAVSVDCQSVLMQYTRQRDRDRRSTTGLTDLLVRTFSNDQPLLGIARASALALLDFVPPLRRSFARRMAFGIRTGL